MKLFATVVLVALLGVSGLRAAPDLDESRLAGIDAIVEEAIQAGKAPGAVVLIGHEGKVVFRKAYGSRSRIPTLQPMAEDTIFDIASLTKVVATTTAIFQLVEQGRIRLMDPVAEYWPEFAANGKAAITIRDLMTHYSGLRPSLSLKPEWSGYETAMQMIVGETPMVPPGSRFIYSDIGFETLGEVVRRVTGQPFDVYCAENIFRPLGMKDTIFNPPAALRERIAPTQYKDGTSGEMLWGKVHDPTAYNMGGVAGHAGLFSTADDLALFAQMLLDGGARGGVRVLSPLSVEKMTLPQAPPNSLMQRALGWDIDSPYATNRGELLPVGSFGHTGFTGTSIWIDPVSRTYIILLSNRVHPDGKGDVGSLRARLATLVGAALGPASVEKVLASRRSLTGLNELTRGWRLTPPRNGQVQTGIDVLAARKFKPLSGRRVGLITNHTGRDSTGTSTVELLRRAPNVTLRAIFSPEHGFTGTEDDRVGSTRDRRTGLPVYSLYGEVERPTARMLEGIDALVFDIQDAGARFYTYITTMAYAMEEAAKKGIPFYVLDRPNPVNGVAVEGPMLDPDQVSFVGYMPMPVRHGMTVGELATMFNRERNISARLHVVKMQGWVRSDWFDETGIEWVNPSPNLRSLTAAALYPGVAMIEGANVSVGRGTDTPFELVGAPWIRGKKLAELLNARRIQGVRFVPVKFTPRSGPFQGKVCEGVNILLLDRNALDAAALGVGLAAALYQLFPDEFDLDKTLRLVGARWVLEAIKAGEHPARIVYLWQEALEEFRLRRALYLLYP
jgi:uncharacterized protein YbbC (DUF1343 family)/CubicO group peptidase (beta-lactamase class C family)